MAPPAPKATPPIVDAPPRAPETKAAPSPDLAQPKTSTGAEMLGKLNAKAAGVGAASTNDEKAGGASSTVVEILERVGHARNDQQTDRKASDSEQSFDDGHDPRGDHRLYTHNDRFFALFLQCVWANAFFI